MRRTAFFKSISPYGKLLLLLGLIILFAIFTAFGGLLVGVFYLDTDMTGLAALLSNPDGDKIIGFTKFYQFVNQLGIFILPVILYSYLVSSSSIEYLRINKKPLAISVLIGIIIVFTILPFLNYLSQINMDMKFPASWAGIENWMIEKEEQAKIITEAFLKTDNITGLSVNIFIIALVPAFGEEFLFRGIILRIFREIFKNVHLAVFISAFIFSLFHLQFFGFLPRLFLGMILGYLFVYSRNLWVPIVFHFVNNAASVIVYYLYSNKLMNTSIEEFGSSDSMVYIIGSLLVTLWLIIIFRQRENYELISESK